TESERKANYGKPASTEQGSDAVDIAPRLLEWHCSRGGQLLHSFSPTAQKDRLLASWPTATGSPALAPTGSPSSSCEAAVCSSP
ncbi:unnamed protein product, partial [Amoebophrya sp. A25]